MNAPYGGHLTGAGYWHAGSSETCPKCSAGPRIFTLTLAQLRTCPKGSLAPEHWHEDGRCACRRYSVTFTPVGWQVIDTWEARDPLAEFGTGEPEYERARNHARALNGGSA